MRRNHRKPSHIGPQPVSVLRFNILKDFEDAHGQAGLDLLKLIREHGLSPAITYDVEEKPIIDKARREIYAASVDGNKEITLHETFLSFVWCVAYGNLVFYELWATPPGERDGTFAARAHALLRYAFGLVEKYQPWDLKLPNPEEYDDVDAYYIEKANAVFVHAVSFILMHEVGHVERGHIDAMVRAKKDGVPLTTHDELIEEYEADDYGIDVMVGRQSSFASTINFQLGVVAGFGSLLLLQKNADGRAHPNSLDRLRDALKRMNVAPNNHLWAIGAAFMMIWALEYGLPLEMREAATTKDLFEDCFRQLRGD